jgi:hypothetical protein
MRYIISLFILAFISQVGFSQLTPSNFVFNQQDATASYYRVNGYGSDYSTGTNYKVYFGQKQNGSALSDDLLVSFDIGTETYTPITLNNGECYDRVVVNRVANSNVSDMDKQTLFFEKYARSGSKVYFTPSYTSIQEAVNTRILNRGGDNVFANAGGSTLNNIERIDLIIEGGVFTPDSSKAGFLINERGGNDDFVVAAITSLDGSGNVNGIGSLFSIDANDWVSTGKSITTTVFQRTSADTYMRPNQDLGFQTVHSVFVTYSDLGIASNQAIYGIVVFPGDVTSSMDLLGLSNVPGNTSASSNNAGGLDLMGGGGYFGASSIQVTDLQVEITTTAVDPMDGDVIDVKITAKNNGPLLDSNIVTDIVIPDGFTYVSASSGYEGSISVNGGTITWEMDELLVNNSEELTLQVMTEPDGDREFTSSITGDKADINLGNNPDNLEIPSGDGGSSLPITWGHVEAINDGGNNILNWSTLTERNNDYFEILKSDDGVSFYSIGVISGNGNSLQQIDYQFIDDNVSGNISYYIIKQVDYDGTVDQSEVLTVSFENQEEINVYPNPSKGNITISNLAQGSTVTVYDQVGHQIMHIVVSNNYIGLDLTTYSEGVYMVRVQNGTQTQIKKLIISE